MGQTAVLSVPGATSKLPTVEVLRGSGVNLDLTEIIERERDLDHVYLSENGHEILYDFPEVSRNIHKSNVLIILNMDYRTLTSMLRFTRTHKAPHQLTSPRMAL